MQLDRIAAVVRPRRSWEAIDLGFQMARAWWAPILRAWMVTVAPFVLILLVALHAYPFWAMLAVWWFKPLYDRVPLFVLSRALFGSVPRVREVWSQMPRLWFSQCLATLTLFRIDPLRVFVLPVGRLEGLRGAEYRERVGVLKRYSEDANAASWLTFSCLIFENAVMLSLLALVDLMRPEEVGDSLWNSLSFLVEADMPLWAFVFLSTLSFLAVTLVEPFYVAAGFALYLNRRTQLEGWDVELAFRRLAERLRAGEPPRSSQGRRKRVGVVGLIVMLWGAGQVSTPFPAQASAQVSPATTELDPQQVIEEVLADEDFGQQRTVTRWRPRWEMEDETVEDNNWAAPLVAALAAVFRVFIWVVFLIGLVLLVLALRRRLGLKDWVGPRLAPPEGPVVTTLAGLDISSQALPDDIVKAALAEWTAGRPDAALSLLYRGALARLVDQRQLPARESWTEEDCLRHLEGSPPKAAPGGLVEYFSRLTTTWQRTAYAHRPPSDEEIQELTGAWPRYFRYE